MKQYQRLQQAYLQGRFPQALLCVGPLYNTISAFALEVSQLLLCSKKEENPCKLCPDCQMVTRCEHPDMEWIKPDKEGGVIKIDQIRALQESVYLTPQRASYRIIVIESADKMNTAAANALLKILEEPAKHTVFILIAQQVSTVLPTVLSRCQLFRFATLEDTYTSNWLLLGEQYPEKSSQRLLLEKAPAIVEGLIAVIEKKTHPCTLASQWGAFEPQTLWWLLYLVYAQTLQMYYTGSKPQGVASEPLLQVAALLNPLLIFSQLDKINTLLKKLSRNHPLNHNLALEELLLDLRGL